MALPTQILQTGATAPGDWLIVAPLLLPLAGAALVTVLPRLRTSVALALMAAALVSAVALLGRVLARGPISMTMGNWLPPFGISFTVDLAGAGLSVLAALLSLLVLIYAAGDRAPQDGDRLPALMLLLLAGVCGTFLTGDLFNLYVWFEVTLIASFGLLSLEGKPIQLDGTVKYGVLNFLATAFFLLALGLLYGLIGTLNMADIIGAASRANPAPLLGIASLLVLAFGMKAAVFPFNSWLPASYHVPPAAISGLFAGLLTKVGIVALLRTIILLLPGLHGTLQPLLTVGAVLTLLIGPLGAIAETNLRRALGFLVIGGIGAMLAGIALGSGLALAGTGFYLVHSMLTMSALFLVAGLVETVTGTTDTRQMGGVYAANGIVSALFLLLVLATAGVPPLLGFWPKLLLLQAGFAEVGQGTGWLAIALVVALLGNAVLTLIAGTRLWAHIFWRAGPEGALAEHAQPNLVRLGRRQTVLGLWPTITLAALIVVVGLAPDWTLTTVRAAADQLLDPAGYIAATALAGGMP